MRSMTETQVIQYLRNGAMEDGQRTAYSAENSAGGTALFDLDLQFEPEPDQEVSDRTLTEAIRKQFLIKVISKKMPGEMLIIDRVVEPPLD